jgi:hypothetical protein
LFFDSKTIACLAKIVKAESFFDADDRQKLNLASCSQNLETAIQTDCKSAKKKEVAFQVDRKLRWLCLLGRRYYKFQQMLPIIETEYPDCTTQLIPVLFPGAEFGPALLK